MSNPRVRRPPCSAHAAVFELDLSCSACQPALLFHACLRYYVVNVGSSSFKSCMLSSILSSYSLNDFVCLLSHFYLRSPSFCLFLRSLCLACCCIHVVSAIFLAFATAPRRAPALASLWRLLAFIGRCSLSRLRSSVRSSSSLVHRAYCRYNLRYGQPQQTTTAAATTVVITSAAADYVSSSR